MKNPFMNQHHDQQVMRCKENPTSATMLDVPSSVALALSAGATCPEGSKCCIMRILTCARREGDIRHG